MVGSPLCCSDRALPLPPPRAALASPPGGFPPAWSPETPGWPLLCGADFTLAPWRSGCPPFHTSAVAMLSGHKTHSQIVEILSLCLLVRTVSTRPVLAAKVSQLGTLFPLACTTPHPKDCISLNKAKRGWMLGGQCLPCWLLQD